MDHPPLVVRHGRREGRGEGVREERWEKEERDDGCVT